MHLRSRLLLLIYKALTAVIAPVGLLYLIRKKRRDPPYGPRKWELLGFVPVAFRRSVWFHTVSVGEVIAARPVIERFIARHTKLNVIVTTTTTTGANEALKIKGITHLFAPLDSPCAVRRFFNAVKPSHLFIMETELWPNLLDEARRHRVSVTVFNARMPEKTCVAYEKHLIPVRDLIARPLNYVIAQSAEDKERFVRIGVPEAHVLVANSLKYDLSPNEKLFKNARVLKKALHLTRVFGALSTHDGEEELILETFFTAREDLPGLKLVLVPRHQSGTEKAIAFLEEIGESYSRRSVIGDDLDALQGDVLIGDTFGEMEFFMGLCDLVFMGGSLIDIGGHNPLEPAYFSLPIVTGPYYYNFKEQFDKLIDVEGAFLAGDNRRLYSLIKMLFNDSEKLARAGMQAFDVQQQGRGAVQKTVAFMEQTLTR